MSTLHPTMLKDSFRWFGPNDPVALSYIRQCGCSGVYTSLHQIPYGDLWSSEAIQERVNMMAEHELDWTAVESVPVSEAIKTRTGDYERHLDNYAKTLINLGAAGVRTVIYNFMPALDWVRTDLAYKLPDGSECLYFDPVKFAAFEVFQLKRKGAEADYTAVQLEAAKAFFDSMNDAEKAQFERSIVDVFPGVKWGLSLDDLRTMLAKYQGISAEQLREHMRLFLEYVVPAAESAGVKLAVHPDDPPFPILGLARIVSTAADLKAVTEMVDSAANGLCYCTGSLGARAENDLVSIVEDLGPRINAVHLRSVQRNSDGSFFEANHLEGSAPMPQIVAALLRENARRADADRLSFRPDHGHRMLDDLGKPANPNPGYDCIGRMRGLAEIRGLQLGLLSQPSASRP